MLPIKKLERNVERNDLELLYKSILNDFTIDLSMYDKKALIDYILNYYNEDYKRIITISTEYELEMLKVIYLDNNKSFAINDTKKHLFTINKHGIVELKDSISKAIDEYHNNKEEYDQIKMKSYYAVGLVRIYGALTSKELNDLYYERFNEKINFNDLYFIFNVKYNEEYKVYHIPMDINIALKLIKTHNSKSIITRYSDDDILSFGEYFVKIPNVFYDIIRRSNEFDKFCYYYMFKDKMGVFYTLEDVLEMEDIIIVLESRNLFPEYELADKAKDRLNVLDVDLFYSVFPKFLLYLGSIYNIDCGELGSINASKGYIVLEKEYNDNFIHLDSFISNNDLTIEEIEIVKAISKGKFDNYIAIKNLSNGCCFISSDETKMYLVKGLKTSFKELLGDRLPIPLTTFIFPYKGQIVCNGLINLIQIYFGPNMSRRLKELYKELKPNMITYIDKIE